VIAYIVGQASRDGCFFSFIATSFEGGKQLFDFWLLPYKINHSKSQKAMCCLSA